MCRLTDREFEYLESVPERNPNFWLRRSWKKAAPMDKEEFTVEYADHATTGKIVNRGEISIPSPMASEFGWFMDKLFHAVTTHWGLIDDQVKSIEYTFKSPVSTRYFLPKSISKDNIVEYLITCRSINEADHSVVPWHHDGVETKIQRNLFNYYYHTPNAYSELNTVYELTYRSVNTREFNFVLLCYYK